jgi:predicted homoserine dehydrogenase-like protein
MQTVQLYDDLYTHEASHERIRVGIVGAGFMGRGIVEVLECTPGMEASAIAEIDLERARSCFEEMGAAGIREVESIEEAERCDIKAERVICTDHRVLTAIDGLDMVIEATGKPDIGAEVAREAIERGKHVGMLNVETDATIGYYLGALARRNNVVYTVCAGDEPAAVKELCDFARTCGFRIVTAGKGKNNPLDRHATPDDLEKRARTLGLNPYILTEFVDGSKTMVEMACAANGMGLGIDRRNMHGPQANIDDLARVFRLQEEGGILGTEGVVDFAIGDVAPGVFAVVRHEGPIANRTLRYLRIGEGPQYLLYRPYHLTNLEVPSTVGWAVIHGRPTLVTVKPPTTEVITIAKRDLKRGDIIDSFGGFSVYGGIEAASRAHQMHLLPLGLAVGATLTEDVEKDAVITYKQVELKPSLLLDLRRAQDKMHGER